MRERVRHQGTDEKMQHPAIVKVSQGVEAGRLEGQSCQPHRERSSMFLSVLHKSLEKQMVQILSKSSAALCSAAVDLQAETAGSYVWHQSETYFFHVIRFSSIGCYLCTCWVPTV